MILLQRPDSGSIRVLGADLVDARTTTEALALRQRWGVMFQHGGLFGSLTVTENVGLPLREHTGLEDALIDEIAAWKLAMTGLEPPRSARSIPSELSGGTRTPTARGAADPPARAPRLPQRHCGLTETGSPTAPPRSCPCRASTSAVASPRCRRFRSTRP